MKILNIISIKWYIPVGYIIIFNGEIKYPPNSLIQGISNNSWIKIHKQVRNISNPKIKSKIYWRNNIIWLHVPQLKHKIEDNEGESYPSNPIKGANINNNPKNIPKI